MNITQDSKFWVVTKPMSLDSTTNDICFQTTIKGLFLQFRGGLSPDDIVGIYDKMDMASELPRN